MDRIRQKLQRIVATLKKDEISAAHTRLLRRKWVGELLFRYLPAIRTLLYFIGFTWMLLLPSSLLGRGIYIDENALSPGQAETHWGWTEVHDSDNILNEIESLKARNASSIERAEYFLSEFLKMGIPAEIQSYNFDVKPKLTGANVYAINSSPRFSGTEAMVISAPWLSHSGEDVVNTRGVSMLLALARFLKRRGIWAKDLIFIISDGSMEGMHAFLSAYHGVRRNNLRTSKLNITSGSIWTAFNIDYPGHSFAQVGLFHEGLNGRLPNQDMMNSFTMISEWNGAPVTLYDTTTKSEPFPILQRLLPSFIKEKPQVQEYLRRARNILRHGSYQGVGKASGVHGLFHQYRIDAFTMYAIPDVGPHGFHTFGRLIESTLRSSNNLLERLHASFFFYIQTTSRTFLKVGHYLPAVIIVSVATMFGALHLWVEAGWVQVPSNDRDEKVKKKAFIWKQRGRPVLDVLVNMGASHIIGYVLWYISKLKSRFPIFSVFAMSIVLVIHGSPSRSNRWKTMKAFTLSLVSIVLSITSLLNFSLSVVLSFALFPLLFTRPSPYWPAFIFAIDMGSRMFANLGTSMQWELYGVWIEPFYYLVYVPLVIDGAIICSLPSLDVLEFAVGHK